MQDYSSLQSSVSMTSLQIDIQSFVSKKSDLILETKKGEKKRYIHQNLGYKICYLSDDFYNLLCCKLTNTKTLTGGNWQK